MKANELMIGDWLKVTDDDTDDSFIGQVKAIDDLGNVNIPEGEDVAYPYSIDCLKPIRLTTEILEKNGFRETDVVVVGIRKMRWESEDCRTEITIWMDDTMPMEIRKNIYYEDEVCYAIPFAWAVHQLQHALRLCGIDKEIVL